MSNNKTEVSFHNTLDTEKSDKAAKLYIYSNNVQLTTDDMQYQFPAELTEVQLKRMMNVRIKEAKSLGTKVKFQYRPDTVLHADVPQAKVNRDTFVPFKSCIYRATSTSIPQAGIVL